MDSLQQTMPIQRQLFKNVGEPQQLAGSCLISFNQPRRRGRFWPVLLVLTATMLLLAIVGQSSIAG
jgi:hypothetical protein